MAWLRVAAFCCGIALLGTGAAPVGAQPPGRAAAPRNRAAVLSPQAQAEREYAAALRRGAALQRQKKTEAARAEFDAAAQLFPARAEPWISRASSYRSDGNWAEARKAALRAFELEPQGRSRNSLLDLINRDLRAKDFEPALDLLEILHRQTPEDLGVVDNLLRCCDALDRPARAVEAGEEGLAVFLRVANPVAPVVCPPFLDLLAAAYLKTGGMPQAAERYLATLSGRKPDSAESVVLCRFLLVWARDLAAREDGGEQALEFLKRAAEARPDAVEVLKENARILRQIRGEEAAIAFLQKTLARIPPNEGLLQDLADLLYRSERYPEAEAAYRRLYGLQPEHSWYIDRLVECLVRQQKIDEATVFVRTVIQSIRSSTLSADRRRALLDGLRERNRDRLDLRELNDEKLAELVQAVKDEPGDAEALNRLGDYYLVQGETRLALSAHLQAAFLGGPEHLIRQTRKLAENFQRNNCRPYIDAVIDHFATDPAIFDVLEDLVRSTQVGNRRFAMEAEQLEAYGAADAACRKILAAPDVSEAMRLKARIRSLRYRNEPLHSDPVLWSAIRSEAEGLIRGEDIPAELRTETLQWIADIDLERLNDPAAAYRMLALLARDGMTAERTVRMADIAVRLRPLPDPAPVLRFVKENPAHLGNPSLLGSLVVWLWDLGRREEALALLKQPETPGIRRGPARQMDRALQALRMRRPEIAAALEEPSARQAVEGKVELQREELVRSAGDRIGAGDAAFQTGKTRLSLPPPLGEGLVRAFLSERPAVADPPVFFGRMADVPTSMGPLFPAGGWTALWRPQAGGEGLQEWELDRPSEEVVPREVLIERSVPRDEDAPDADSFQYRVHVRVPGPYRLIYRFRNMRGALRDVQPASGVVDAAANTVSFDQGERADDAGTTFSVTWSAPGTRATRRTDQPMTPGIEVVTLERSRESVLSRSPSGWVLEDSDPPIRFELEPPAELNPAEPPPVRIVLRRVYLLDSGDRR